jgi:hypothetical protein
MPPVQASSMLLIHMPPNKGMNPNKPLPDHFPLPWQSRSGLSGYPKR